MILATRACSWSDYSPQPQCNGSFQQRIRKCLVAYNEESGMLMASKDKIVTKRSRKNGSIQHHLAVLAHLNIVQQLFYYSKALGVSLLSRMPRNQSYCFSIHSSNNIQYSRREYALPLDFSDRETTARRLRSARTCLGSTLLPYGTLPRPGCT